jgi:hypothetical protein
MVIVISASPNETLNFCIVDRCNEGQKRQTCVCNFCRIVKLQTQLQVKLQSISCCKLIDLLVDSVRLELISNVLQPAKAGFVFAGAVATVRL